MRIRHLLLTCLAGGALAFAGCAEDGKDGVDGAQGPAGDNGADGAAGTAGANGADGAAGAAGDNGVDGAAAECSAFELITFVDVTGFADPVLTDEDITFSINFLGDDGGAIGPDLDIRFLQEPVELTSTGTAGEFTVNFDDADAGAMTYLGVATDNCSVTFFEFEVEPELWRAYISVVHVSPSAPAVKIVPAGTTTAFPGYDSLAPGDAGQLIATNQNLTDITVSVLNAADDAIIATLPEIKLARDQHITVVALEDAAGATMFTVVDTGSADFSDPLNTQVNAFHAGAGVGELDIYDIGDAMDLNDDAIVFDGLTFNNLSTETLDFAAASDLGDGVFTGPSFDGVDPISFGVDTNADAVSDLVYTIAAGEGFGEFYPSEYGTTFIYVDGDGMVQALHRTWSFGGGVFFGSYALLAPPCFGPTCDIAETGGAITIEGSIDDDDSQWDRPSSCGGQFGDADHYYDVFTIANNTATDKEVTVTAVFGDDGYLHAYSNPFDPADNTGCIAGDDEFGNDDGAQIEKIAIPAGGSIDIIVSVFDADTAIGAYSLTVESFDPPPPPAPEVEPNNDYTAGQTIEVGVGVLGEITTDDDVDYYTVVIAADGDYEFNATQAGNGNNVDLEMWLCDSTDPANCDDTGGNVFRQDSGITTENRTAMLTAGTYYVGLAHWNRGNTGEYLLTIDAL
ncbi:MAG: hypothetical protein ACI9MR_002982 [Myxococcota bacterium]|jgi:hypothetical protein